MLLSIMYKRMDLDDQQLGICNAGLLGVYISNYICNYWYIFVFAVCVELWFWSYRSLCIVSHSAPVDYLPIDGTLVLALLFVLSTL